MQRSGSCGRLNSGCLVRLESCRVLPCMSMHTNNPFPEETWCSVIGALEAQNSIQSGVLSTDGATGSVLDDTLRIGGSVWVDPNRNRYVSYLNENAGKRNVNLNYLDNDWNKHVRFLAVRNFLDGIYCARPGFRAWGVSCFSHADRASIRRSAFRFLSAVVRALRMYAAQRASFPRGV